MKFFSLSTLLLGALSSVTAQSLDPTYIQAIIQALGAANLTSLANAAQSVANTTQGATFLAQLAGSNKTLLAPNNDAFAAVDSSVTSNATLVAEILSYHVLNVSLSPSQIANSTNHTIARSLYLSGGLPANRTSPVVLTRMSGNSSMSMNGTGIEALQLDSNASVIAGPVSAANFMIYVIDEVLSLPPSLTDVATAVVPSLAGLIQQANLLDALENTKGVTVFAPSDSAVAGIAEALQTLNSTTVTQVLANHVIVGAAVYSTQLMSSNYTSAGGEPFRFMSNSSGVYVMSGSSTARIIRSDIITQNGVVHVIDNVLVNPASNPAAASSAASSYAVAATATTANGNGGVIGVSSTHSATGAASSRAASSGAASSLSVGSIVPVFVSLGAIAAGVAAGAAML